MGSFFSLGRPRITLRLPSSLASHLKTFYDEAEQEEDEEEDDAEDEEDHDDEEEKDATVVS